MLRRPVLLAVLIAVLLAASLTGCGDDDAPTPHDAAATQALWNPCTGLDRARVERLLGERVLQQSGTETAPRCTFSPKTEGGAALDVNYQLFQGTLDELFDTFGQTSDDTRVIDVDLPDADGARIVVSAKRTLAVSGFVQNGQLVQLVNALDPTPYDRARLVRAVRGVLADLATYAAGTQVATGTPTGMPSPS